MGRTPYLVIAGIALLALLAWFTQSTPPPSEPLAAADPTSARRTGTGAKVLAPQDQPPALWSDEQKARVRTRLGNLVKKREAMRAEVARAQKTAGIDENTEWKRNLAGQDLKGAQLEGEDLSQANLHGANLESAQLSGADLSGSDVSGANLMGATLTNAQIVGTDFSGADLRGSHFGDAYIEGIFEKADMRGIDMRGAGLIETNMRNADLRNAFFDMASINADLTDADLRGAVFKYADLFGSNLAGANVDGADFSDVTNLTCEQLMSAKNWQAAKVNQEFHCEPPP